MADLYQSEYDEIKLRQSQQDLQTLLLLLDEDGAISVVDDPSAKEIEKAQAELSKRAAQAAEEDEKDAEAQEKERREVAALTRTASMPVPVEEEKEKDADAEDKSGE